MKYGRIVPLVNIHQLT